MASPHREHFCRLFLDPSEYLFASYPCTVHKVVVYTRKDKSGPDAKVEKKQLFPGRLLVGTKNIYFDPDSDLQPIAKLSLAGARASSLVQRKEEFLNVESSLIVNISRRVSPTGFHTDVVKSKENIVIALQEVSVAQMVSFLTEIIQYATVTAGMHEVEANHVHAEKTSKLSTLINEYERTIESDPYVEAFITEPSKPIGEFRACLQTLEGKDPGVLMITQTHFVFQPFVNLAIDGSIIIPLSNVVRLIPRTHCYRDDAFELFTVTGRIYSIILQDNKARDQCVSIFRSSQVSAPNLKSEESLEDLTERWLRDDITNAEYILELNYRAGRSVNDILAYPIFPWTATYSRGEDGISAIRDFASSLASSHAASENGGKDWPLHVHPAFVASVFQRALPELIFHYSQAFDPLPAIDSIEGLLRDLQATVDQSGKNPIDLRMRGLEATPEFYTGNGFWMAAHPGSLSNVVLPHGIASVSEFLRTQLGVLNSRAVGAALPSWIDAVFGTTQRDSVFDQETQQVVKLRSIPVFEGCYDAQVSLTPYQEIVLYSSLLEFGCLPEKVFSEAHPCRLDKHYSASSLRAEKSSKHGSSSHLERWTKTSTPEVEEHEQAMLAKDIQIHDLEEQLAQLRKSHDESASAWEAEKAVLISQSSSVVPPTSSQPESADTMLPSSGADNASLEPKGDDVEKLKQQIEELERSVESEKQLSASLSQKLQQAEDKSQSLETKVGQVDSEFQFAQAEIRRLQDIDEKRGLHVSELEQLLVEKTTKISALESDLSVSHAKQADLAAQGNQVARAKLLEEELKTTDEELQTVEEDLRSTQEELHKLRAQHDVLLAQLKGSQDELNAKQSDVEMLQSRLAQIENEKDHRIVDLENQVRELQQSASQHGGQPSTASTDAHAPVPVTATSVPACEAATTPQQPDQADTSAAAAAVTPTQSASESSHAPAPVPVAVPVPAPVPAASASASGSEAPVAAVTPTESSAESSQAPAPAPVPAPVPAASASASGSEAPAAAVAPTESSSESSQAPAPVPAPVPATSASVSESQGHPADAVTPVQPESAPPACRPPQGRSDAHADPHADVAPAASSSITAPPPIVYNDASQQTDSEAAKVDAQMQSEDVVSATSGPLDVSSSSHVAVTDAALQTDTEERSLTLEADLNTARAECESLKGEIRLRDDKIVQLESQVGASSSTSEATAVALAAELALTKDKLSVADSDLQSAKERCVSLENELANSRAETATAVAEVDRRQVAHEQKAAVVHEENESLRKEASELRKSVNDLQTELESVKSQSSADLSRSIAEVEALQKDLSNAQAENSRIRETIVAKDDRIDVLTADLSAAEGKLSDAQTSLSSANNQNTSLTDEITGLRKRVEELEADLAVARTSTSADASESQRQISEMKSEKEALASQLATTKENVAVLEGRIVELEKELQSSKDEVQARDRHIQVVETESSERVASLESEAKALHDKNTDLESQIRTLEKDHADYVTKSDAELKSSSDRAIAIENELKTEQRAHEDKVAHLEADRSSLQSKLDKSLADARAEEDRLHGDITRLNKEVADMQEKCTRLEASANQSQVYQQEAEKATEERQRSERRVVQLEEEIASLKSKLEQTDGELAAAEARAAAAEKDVLKVENARAAKAKDADAAWKRYEQERIRTRDLEQKVAILQVQIQKERNRQETLREESTHRSEDVLDLGLLMNDDQRLLVSYIYVLKLQENPAFAPRTEDLSTSPKRPKSRNGVDDRMPAIASPASPGLNDGANHRSTSPHANGRAVSPPSDRRVADWKDLDLLMFSSNRTQSSSSSPVANRKNGRHSAMGQSGAVHFFERYRDKTIGKLQFLQEELSGKSKKIAGDLIEIRKREEMLSEDKVLVTRDLADAVRIQRECKIRFAEITEERRQLSADKSTLIHMLMASAESHRQMRMQEERLRAAKTPTDSTAQRQDHQVIVDAEDHISTLPA